MDAFQAWTSTWHSNLQSNGLRLLGILWLGAASSAQAAPTATQNRRGLEAMKQAMREVDGSGMFQFSDKHAESFGSLFTYDERQLIDDLVEQLDGSEMTVDELYEYALVNTPASTIYSAFGTMESERQLRPVDAPEDRRRKSFKRYPEMRVQIERCSCDQTGTLWST